MLVAVACKLLRAIYGMLKYNTKFDINMVLKSFDFSKCNKEKFIEEYNRGRNFKITDEEIKELFVIPNVEKLF